MIVTLSLFTIVLSYCILPWLWQKLKKKHPRTPPLYPGDLPVIGHAHLFLGDARHAWKWVRKLAHSSLENGGVVTFKLGTWAIHGLTDPEDCSLIGDNFLQKDEVYNMAKPWVGEGLVTAPVQIWKRHRKLVNPAFSQYVLDGYLTVFNSQSRKLAQELAKEVGRGFFNHESYVGRCTLEIISLTAMGIDEEDDLLDSSQYMDAADHMFNMLVQRVQSTWMINDFLFKLSTLRRKQDKLVKILHDMSNEVIKKRKSVLFKPECAENFGKTPKRFKSFLDLLLESSVDGSLSDTEIREEVDTMIAAGYDTSASLLTMALVLIGSHADVQARIYQELQEVFEGSDRDVDKHDLPKLVYLEAVLKEVLRLYPVVPMIARYLDRDVELKNYTLSAGSSCFIMVYGIHRHAVWGPDRMQFKPERWLDPARLPENLNIFAGFGIGRRSCIGPKFAFMSAKTTLAHMLRKYKITADHTQMVLKIDVMLKASSGHYIQLELR